MKTLQFSLLSIFLVLALTNCGSAKSDEKENEEKPVPEDENLVEEENHEQEVMTAIQFAQHVAQNLKNESFGNWNQFTAEEVYFSPYAHVDTANVVSLNATEFSNLLDSGEKIAWGSFDGTGKEIKFSVQEYFDRFVTDFDLTAASNQLLKDTIPPRGNELYNANAIFPNATVVEIHKPASDESMGLDWRSLMLVIEKVEGEWKLKALIHNEWTT